MRESRRRCVTWQRRSSLQCIALWGRMPGADDTAIDNVLTASHWGDELLWTLALAWMRP